MKKFKENVPLAKFTNYKIGGPARFFFEAKDERSIAWALAEAKARRLPIFVLGGGTNLLVSDEGFDGLVLRINIGGMSGATELAYGGRGRFHGEAHFVYGQKFPGRPWLGRRTAGNFGRRDPRQRRMFRRGNKR